MPASSGSPSRVFVRIPNWVGDVVMATGVLRELRRQLPEAHLVLGARAHLHALLDGEPVFDELIDTPKAKGWSGIQREARRLRAFDFDLALLLPNSLETALIAWRAGIPRRVGYRQGRSPWITAGPRAKRGRPFWSRRGPRRIPEPMPGYYARLLEFCGLEAGDPSPRISCDPRDLESVDRWIEARGLAGRPLVLFTCGAAYGASKLWSAERFAEMARRVMARGEGAVLLAGPAEIDRAKEIAAAAPGAVPAIGPILTFGELKALCTRASAMVTTDTGPRHLAVAAGLPLVCVMGPTDPRYTNYGLDRQIVIRRTELECLPCQRKICPLGHHDCMERIEVDHVDAALAEVRARVLPRA